LHRFYRSSKVSKNIRRLEKVSPFRNKDLSQSSVNFDVASHPASPLIAGNIFNLAEIQYQHLQLNKSLSSEFPIVQEEIMDGLLLNVREETIAAKWAEQTRRGILSTDPSDESRVHDNGMEICSLVNEALDIEISNIPVFAPKQSPCQQTEDDDESLSMEYQLGEDQLWKNLKTLCHNFIDIPTASFLCETVLED
jgi:hypothetical protein